MLSLQPVTFQPWDLIGYLGNAIFGSRFIVQWVVSEQRKSSVIPTVFWWLSLLGTLVLAIYFIGLRNGPGIVGSVPNAAIYIRNLQLIRKQKLAGAPSSGNIVTPERKSPEENR